jgi:hypothetical protein
MRIALATIVFATALTTGTATAREPGPYDVKQVDATQPLPKGVKAKGAVVEQVWTWQDGDLATDGLAVFSSTETVKDGHLTGRKIYVQYFRGKAGKWKQVRLITDGVSGCEFDVIAKFLPGSVQITDEDTDMVSELSFAYDVTCTSDVSPSTRKLLVLEGKDKHALRGTSRINAGPDSFGGEFKPDGFKKAPALKALAEAQWKALLGS